MKSLPLLSRQVEVRRAPNTALCCPTVATQGHHTALSVHGRMKACQVVVLLLSLLVFVCFCHLTFYHLTYHVPLNRISVLETEHFLGLHAWPSFQLSIEDKLNHSKQRRGRQRRGETQKKSRGEKEEWRRQTQTEIFCCWLKGYVNLDHSVLEVISFAFH